MLNEVTVVIVLEVGDLRFGRQQCKELKDARTEGTTGID
jgi:hypothetical protein